MTYTRHVGSVATEAELANLQAGADDRQRSVLASMRERNSLGMTVTYELKRPRYSREEESGFHWLLGQWLERDTRIENFSLEDLKEWVCAKHFGTAVKVDPDGNELPVALRRTTRIWDPDKKRYTRKLLDWDGYSELIAATYRFANERGVTLPEMKKGAA